MSFICIFQLNILSHRTKKEQIMSIMMDLIHATDIEFHQMHLENFIKFFDDFKTNEVRW